MALQWRESAILEVDRQPPVVAPTGKILHLSRAARGERDPGA
jgi:hypothetical protein